MMAFTSLLYARESSAWVVRPQAWIALTYSILFSTMVSYFLIAWAHQRTSSTLVAVYNTIQPVSAAFLSFLFLGFTPTWNQGVGGKSGEKELIGVS
jgi:drug/metabolite transporter (DMT)-like permease